MSVVESTSFNIFNVLEQPWFLQNQLRIICSPEFALISNKNLLKLVEHKPILPFWHYTLSHHFFYHRILISWTLLFDGMLRYTDRRHRRSWLQSSRTQICMRGWNLGWVHYLQYYCFSFWTSDYSSIWPICFPFLWPKDLKIRSHILACQLFIILIWCCDQQLHHLPIEDD